MLSMLREAATLNEGDVSALAAIKLMERAAQAEIQADHIRLHALGVTW